MDTNKMREQFESKFQTPIGMAWCDVAQQYVKALGCICPLTAITAHNQLWKCWQASREAVVVELPEPETIDVDCDESLEMEPEEYEVLEASHGARWSEHSRLKKAIEAQGLKVAP